jgi:hypothetical protein
MRKRTLTAFAALFVMSSAVTYSQRPGSPVLDRATVVSRDEIETVLKSPGGGDRMVKMVDLDRYYIGVAVLRRGATTPGQPALGGINHTKITEAYYVVSGSGTMITGTEKDMKDLKPVAEPSGQDRRRRDHSSRSVPRLQRSSGSHRIRDGSSGSRQSAQEQLRAPVAAEEIALKSAVPFARPRRRA